MLSLPTYHNLGDKGFHFEYPWFNWSSIQVNKLLEWNQTTRQLEILKHIGDPSECGEHWIPRLDRSWASWVSGYFKPFESAFSEIYACLHLFLSLRVLPGCIPVNLTICCGVGLALFFGPFNPYLGKGQVYNCLEWAPFYEFDLRSIQELRNIYRTAELEKTSGVLGSPPDHTFPSPIWWGHFSPTPYNLTCLGEMRGEYTISAQ